MKTKIRWTAVMFILTLTSNLYAQKKWDTRNAKVSFQSETSVEKIYSENNQVTSILKDEGQKKIVAFNVLMRSFKFEKALMEEHFNEKYVHSEKFPAAKFVGEIVSPIDLGKPGLYKNIKVSGTFTLHGVMKPLIIIAEIEVRENQEIRGVSSFKINPEDFAIEIPKLVDEKISKEITVNIDALYKPSK